MGKEKYQKEIEILFKKSLVIDINSIKRIIRKTKKVKQYAKHVIRNLILKGKIRRLTKGYYTSYNDPSLAVFCFKSSYLGLQDAMSFHNLWEQETTPVIITTKKMRQGIRKIMGVNVLVRRIDKKYFFGFDYFKQNSFYLPYSDVEKTFLDMAYFKEKLGEEAIKNFKKRVNKQKLNSYLRFYPKKFRKRTLNLLVP